jgi:hypothetical protein
MTLSLRRVLVPSLTALLAASLVLMADAPATLTQGLIGYWKFDETAGEQVKDSSGKANHGTLRGAVRAAGKFGGAVDCKQDAFVVVPDSGSLSAMKEGTTITAWVNWAGQGSWDTVVSREVKAGWSEYFGLAVVKNKALFSVDPDGEHYRNTKSAEDMPPGQWIHLAGTYDNAEFKLYVNGRLVKSDACTVAFQFQDKNPLLIGGNSNDEGKTWVDCFHGRIDEVRLYSRPLTAAEILALCNLKTPS